MTPTRVLLDTAVVAYAIGGAHPMRHPCRRIIAAVAEGRLRADASVELVQELLFHRLRRTDRAVAVRQSRDAARLCHLHPFDDAVLAQALDLVGAHDRIGGRDAIHAATALVHGVRAVCSPDLAFDGIAGIDRWDPADLATRLDGGTSD